MSYLFQNATAFDPYTGQGVPNAMGQVYAMSDTTFTSPLTVVLLSSGLQTTELVSDQYSQLPGFDAGDNVQVRFRSGEFVKVLNTSTPLVGPTGDTGKSAYEVAVEGGYTGTEAEYNATLTDAPNLVARAETAEAAAVDAAKLVGAPADVAIATAINGPGTLTETALSAAIVESAGPSKVTAPRFLDAYANYFYGTHTWVAGQTITPTTLASSVSAGASILPVASASGLLPGVALVTNAGTATEQQFKVVSVAGNNATVEPAVVTPLSSGATVAPWWADAIHPLTSSGGASFGYWAANAKIGTQFAIRDVPAGNPVTVLGDSWVGRFFGRFMSALQARLPGVTVVNAGIAGNTAAMMIARFDADVPANSAYVVINEPGVNDAPTTSLDIQAAQLRTLVEKIRAIGAIPVITGPVPLANNQAQAIAQAQAFRDQLANPESYPSVTGDQLRRAIAPTLRPEPFSIGIGDDALSRRTSGTTNTALGYRALAQVTSGTSNTGLGYQALTSVTSGNSNTAFGNNALATNTASSNTGLGARALTANTTGVGNVAVGANTLAGNTTGPDNTAVGVGALALNVSGASNTGIGSGALAKNTGHQNTAVGAFALPQNTTAAGSTALGYAALLASTGAGNTALGAAALLANTTGANNTAVGKGAGASPNGVGGNATIAGANQTLVGYQAGQSSADTLNDVVAVGTNATVGATGAVAIGSHTNAPNPNQVAIGPRSQMSLNVAVEPPTPTGGGVFYVQAGALKYKGSSGTVTVIAPA